MQIDTGPPWIPNVFSAKKNLFPQTNVLNVTSSSQSL